jgi:Na+/melibiose symporter-like transporter
VMYESAILGWTLCFLVPPQLVREHDTEPSQRRGLAQMWVAIALGAAALFVGVVVYFPNKPRLPPSASAALPKLDFRAGCAKLARNSQFWLLLVCFALPNGVQQAWSSALDVIIQPAGFSQSQAANLGLASVGAGAVFGVVLGRLADGAGRSCHRELIGGLLLLSSAGFLVFCLVCAGALPRTTPLLYASTIVGVAGEPGVSILESVHIGWDSPMSRLFLSRN